MSFLDLVTCALAVWEIVEIWKHGTIFASWRARVELWENSFGTLLSCGFCLAPWCSWLVLFIAFVPLAENSLWAQLQVGIRLTVYGFAVARLANLGNDLTHKWCRTPRDKYAFKEDDGTRKTDF